MALGLGALVLAWPNASASAQNLFLGPVARHKKPKIVLDPRLPTGPSRLELRELSPLGRRLCSARRPVCVEAIPTLESEAPRALLALETAWTRLVLAAGLPAPLRGDQGQPLVLSLDSPTLEPLTVTERLRLGPGIDRAAVVCHAGSTLGTPSRRGARTSLPGGSTERLGRNSLAVTGPAVLDRLASLCVAEGIAARLDPAETPSTRRGYALSLWWAMGEPGGDDLALMARSADYSEQAGEGRSTEAARWALWVEHFDRSRGAGELGSLPTALLALSGQRSPAGVTTFQNEPDSLDILRETLEDSRAEFAAFALEHAVARAQLGKEAGPLGRVAWGKWGALPRRWTLPLSSLPRRVAIPQPLDPLGATAVAVSIGVPPPQLELAVQIAWESPARFTWTILKLDAQQQELGRLDIAYEDRQTQVERRVVVTSEVRELLIVGTHLGGVDLSHPLDPDHAPFEPHGATVYVAKLHE